MSAEIYIPEGRGAMAKSLYEYCTERGEPGLLSQWDSEKNGSISPHDVSYGSHKKIWWRCGEGHQWETAVYIRTGAGSGCPYCAGKKLLPDARTLATEYPQLAKEWHPAKNHGLSPTEVTPATHRKVWWVCDKGHEWQAQVNARARGTGCPICANRKVSAGENDLAAIYPDIAAQWHPEKNAPLSPRDVVPGSHAKVWWKCEYGHEWQAAVLSRTGNGNGCPVCAGKQILPGENDLASAFPQVAAQWHPTRNGTLTPRDVPPYSNRRVWWVCELGHEYAAVTAQRTTGASDCPYCTGRKVLPGFNDLETKEPRIAAQWHPTLNETLTPRMVTTGSRKKVWWQCGEGHVWKAVVYSRAGTQKSGCPVCAGRSRESRRGWRAPPECCSLSANAETNMMIQRNDVAQI